jgi:hypothetical protein
MADGAKLGVVLLKIKYVTGAAVVLAGQLRSISFAEVATAVRAVSGANVEALTCAKIAADAPSSSTACTA